MRPTFTAARHQHSAVAKKKIIKSAKNAKFTGGRLDEAHERFCSYSGLSSNQQIETTL